LIEITVMEITMKNPTKRIRMAIVLLLSAFCILQVSAQGTTETKVNPAFVEIEDNPSLPRVLLIGDSISIGYTLPVRKQLEGIANVHRIPENGGPTLNGLEKLEQWLGNGHWDVIHFNWGLHDIKIMESGKHQVPIEDYEKNLRQLVEILKKTGARLIWASTTPVPEGVLSPLRNPGDEVRYNSIAGKIMEENGIAIDDLYSFAFPRLGKIQRPANVHFTDEGSEILAGKVSLSVKKALGITDYLAVVRGYADTMIEYGRDDYGEVHSPLFAAALDRKILRLPQEQPASITGIREHDRTWTGANPMHDLNLYQALYGLTKITGEPKYAKAADNSLQYFFNHCQSATSCFFAWGEHLGWDFHTEKPLAGRDSHEFYRPWVLWKHCYELAPEPCKEFATGLWENQIGDHETGNFSRHASYHSHKAGLNAEFPRHGGFYIATWAEAYQRTGNEDYLRHIEKLVNYFDSRRNPKTGAIPSQSSAPEQVWPTSNLSLAVDLWDSAEKVPAETAKKMRACAMRTDEVFLKIPQAPQTKGFFIFALASTLQAGSVVGDKEIHSRIWATGYGQETHAQTAMLCLLRYRQIKNEKYRDLFMGAAEQYLTSEPDRSITLYPGALGDAIALMVNAYRLTGEKKYLDRADFFGKQAVEIFFGEYSLPAASSEHDHYEAITRGDTLARELLELWAVQNQPDLDLGFVWAER